MFSGGKIHVDGNPVETEWDVEAFAHNLIMIDYLLFKKLKPDIYLQIVTKPGNIEGGGYNVPLKLLLEYCEWFRTVS
jgi:hypothetical protein